MLARFQLHHVQPIQLGGEFESVLIALAQLSDRFG